MKTKPQKGEKELLDSFEKGEWKRVKTFDEEKKKSMTYAKETIKRNIELKLTDTLNKALKQNEEQLYRSFHIPYFEAVNSQSIEVSGLEYLKLSKNYIYYEIFLDAHVPWDLKEAKRNKLISEILNFIKKEIDKNICIKKGRVTFYVHCYGVYGSLKEYPKGKWKKNKV